MAHQTSGQFGFADFWLRNNPKLNQHLDKINRLVDWKPFEAKLSRIYSSPTGRPSYPLLLLLKGLLLQTWHCLSDYTLEESLREFIRKIVMTPASVHDGEMLPHVIGGDEDWAFADKAYDSAKNHQVLREKGIENGILMKGTCKRKLCRAEKMCNRILSKLRCPVERVFGTLKRSYRYSRARYLGLKKNCLQLTMMSMAYNLRRMAKRCA